MTIHYSILFTIELLHEYYSNGRTEDVELVPAADTALLLQKMGVVWRKSGSRYLAYCKAREKTPGVYTPAINTGTQTYFRADFGKTPLRFLAVQTASQFLNLTALDLVPGMKYSFSNLTNNQKGGTLFLTAPVAPFAAGKDYVPGNLVERESNEQVFEALTKHTSTGVGQLTNKAIWQPKGLRFGARPLKKFTVGKSYQQGEWVTGTGNKVFEALKNTTASAASELSNTKLWKARGEGERQYPTANDRVVYSTGSYLFALSIPAQTITINVFGFNCNETTPAFDVPALTPTVEEWDTVQPEVVVNLTSLPPGKYVVDVNGEKALVYYDPAFRRGEVFGVIEIFNHLAASNPYAFLTAGEEIRPADYVIHFPARSVLWKYHRKDQRAAAITDTGDSGYAFALEGNAFVSSRPIPLSQDPVETLELSFSDSVSKLAPLPNPPAQRLGRTAQNDFSYLSAEMFLNY